MSGVLFNCLIGAIDGMMVWTMNTPKKNCKKKKCGENYFLCSRKDTFSLNLQAICDHKLRFT